MQWRGVLALERGMLSPLGAYEFLERIGKGSFGEVFRGRHRDSDETVAIKVIDLEQADDEIEDIQQEISVMAQCDSPHVTKYYGSYVVGTRLYLIMEHVGGGSILDMMDAGPIEEAQIATILCETLKGLDYLHTQGKIHRCAAEMHGTRAWQQAQPCNVCLSCAGTLRRPTFCSLTQER